MKFPDDVRELLKRKFKNNHKEWLREALSTNAAVSENGIADSFPLEISLNIPTEQDTLKQPDGVRLWISAWRVWQGSNQRFAGSLVWSERRWRSLGIQSVPQKLILENADDAASWIGETERWKRAVGRFKILVQRWSALLDILPKHFNILADYSDSDILRLLEVISWLYANPNSNLYIRQIPVNGIDSKWLESRKGLISELMASINTKAAQTGFTHSFRCADSGENDFYKLCGIKPLPNLIRIRVLDQKLRNHLGGLGDISAPLEYIAELTITPTTVFIIENLQTGLAFEDLTGSVVIMKLGYGVEVLEKIKWLQNVRCIYWGDIDTHGFAILNRARSYLPSLESILMDKATLLSHKELWGKEEKQSTQADLPLLTGNETELFKSLRNNIFGQQVRLEQERIRWNEACDVIKNFI